MSTADTICTQNKMLLKVFYHLRTHYMTRLAVTDSFIPAFYLGDLNTLGIVGKEKSTLFSLNGTRIFCFIKRVAQNQRPGEDAATAVVVTSLSEIQSM